MRKTIIWVICLSLLPSIIQAQTRRDTVILETHYIIKDILSKGSNLFFQIESPTEYRLEPEWIESLINNFQLMPDEADYMLAQAGSAPLFAIDRKLIKNRITLVSAYDLRPFEEGILIGSLAIKRAKQEVHFAYHIYSTALFNKSFTKAILHKSYHGGPMVGYGEYLFLEKTDGKWTIITRWPTWIS